MINFFKASNYIYSTSTNIRRPDRGYKCKKVLVFYTNQVYPDMGLTFIFYPNKIEGLGLSGGIIPNKFRSSLILFIKIWIT